MRPPAPPDAELHWVVSAEMIDLDRWARVYIDVQRGRTLPGSVREGARPPFHQRHPIPFALGLLAVALAAYLLMGVDSIVSVAVLPFMAFLVVLIAVHATAPGRVARHLRAIPALHESFRFVAGPGGTSAESATGREQLHWSRYEGVMIRDEVVALMLQGGTVRLLPLVGLVGATPPELVLATMDGWIRANRPTLAAAT